MQQPPNSHCTSPLSYSNLSATLRNQHPVTDNHQRISLAAHPTSGRYPDVYMFEHLERPSPSLSPILSQREDNDPGIQQQQQQQRSRRGSADTYASRHLVAEQRRRARINERLDKLRMIVPHAEKANIAAFLEEAQAYIERLNADVARMTQELEERDSRIQRLLRDKQEAQYLDLRQVVDDAGEMLLLKKASSDSHHSGMQDLLGDHEVGLNSFIDDVDAVAQHREDKSAVSSHQPDSDIAGK